MAHIRRWDCLTQVLGQIARALHWFNPLAWLALRQLRIEQECACDDIVLNFGANAEDYAAELLSVTAHLPRDSWDAAVALAMSRTSRIECRLNAILNSGAERRPLSPGRVLAIVSLISLLAIGIAAARPQTTAAADVNAAVTQGDLSDDAPLVNPTGLESAEQERPNVASEVSAVAPENKVETEIPQASNTPKVAKPVVELGFENGDFETDKVFHGIPPAAIPEKQCANSKYVRLALEQEGHSSSHSASITIDAAHPPDHVSYSWLTKLRGWKPEQALEISAWVKTNDVKTSPGLSVHCWGKHMSLLAVASTHEKSQVTGISDWVRLSTLVFVPQETDQIQVRAFLTMPDNGGAKVWFDDFKAVETDIATANATMRHLSLIERAPRNIEILRSPWTPGRRSSWSAEIDGGTYRCQIFPSYLGPRNSPRTGIENQPVQRIWYQSVTETNGGSWYPVPRMSVHLENIDRDTDANLNP